MNIVVTGASRGIGFETVLKLNTDPQNEIIAIARNEKLLNELIEQGINPNNIHVISADLSDFSQYKSSLLIKILNAFDKVDVLINNAGLLVNKRFETQSDLDFDEQINVNLKIPFKITQLLLPYFNSNSHILNISSMGGFQGSVKFSGLSIYSASKAALAVMTEAIATEFADRDIKANCLALGATQTEMLAEAFPGYDAPLKASEMAKYIADFAVNGHKFYNGKILPVALSTP